MPILPSQNVSQADTDQWQFLATSQANEQTVQSLLFNILTLILAIASLVVAWMHMMHQRKSNEDRDFATDRSSNREAPRDDGAPNERTYTAPVLRAYPSADHIEADVGHEAVGIRGVHVIAMELEDNGPRTTNLEESRLSVVEGDGNSFLNTSLGEVESNSVNQSSDVVE